MGEDTNCATSATDSTAAKLPAISHLSPRTHTNNSGPKRKRITAGAIEKTQAMGGRIVFYVYDILEDGGVDLRGEPLRDRMAALRRLALGGSGLVRQAKNYSWAARKRAIEESVKGGGEGIVIKSLSAPYRHRPKDEAEPWGDVWKYKAPGVAAHTEDVILRSYTKGKEKLIFAAYVYRQQKQVMVGKLSGLDKATERKVKAMLDKGKSVVAEVSYQERLPSGRNRSGSGSLDFMAAPLGEGPVRAYLLYDLIL